MAAQAFREQGEEARAALDPMQVPMAEEADGDLLAGDSAGAAEWLGGLDPEDFGGVDQGYPRFPLFPGSRLPFPGARGRERGQGRARGRGLGPLLV